MAGESEGLLDLELTADAAPLKAGLGEADAAVRKALESTEMLSHAIDTMTEEMAKSREAAEHAKEGHEENAGAIGMAVEGYHLAAEAVMQLWEAFGELGNKAIEAANEMDPQGAVKWTEAVEGLKSSFETFLGQIGTEIRPGIESIMHTMEHVFDYLARLDWSTIFSSLFEILDIVLAKMKTWGESVLDFLSWPFRQLLSVVETTMAGLMQGLGEVLNKIGSTAIGSKMGVGVGSGDAFTDTALDMSKQADKLKAGFMPAIKEIGAGLSDTLSAAIDGSSVGAATAKLRAAIAGAGSTEDLEKVKTEQQLAVEANLFRIKMEHVKDQQEAINLADQEHIRTVRQNAMIEKQEMMEKFAFAKQEEAKAKAKLGFDEGKGDLTAIAGDREALAKAVEHVTEAGKVAASQMSDAYHAEQGLSEAFATRAAKAEADWKAAEAHADAMSQLQKESGSGADITQQAEQAAQVAEFQHGVYLQINAEMIAAHTAAARLQVQAATESRTIGNEGAKEAAAVQEESAKKAAEFYGTTLKSTLGSLGGSAGNVASGAVSGAAAAGPAGALVGAGAALLSMSKEAHAFAAAVSEVVQSLADSVGRLLSPLIPLITLIGSVYGPYWAQLGDMLGRVFGVVAEVLIPVLGILSPVLKVVGLAFEGVGKLLEGVAFIIRKLIDGVASVWNGILDVLSKVFDVLAHALPGGAGDKMRDFYNSLQGMKINVDNLDTSMANAANGINAAAAAAVEFSTTVNGLNSTIQSSFQKMQDDLTKVDALRNTLNQAKANGADQSYIDALTKALAQATAQYNLDKDAQDIAAYQAALATGSGNHDAEQQGLAYALTKQAADQAAMSATTSNTAATAANTVVTQSLIATLTNMPSGFRAALYENGEGGTAPTSRMIGARDNGGHNTGDVYLTGPVIIQANDPGQFHKALREHVATARAGVGGRW